MSGARLPGPERRQQLIEVARTVLARRGFHETSMNEIADAAGVTKPVLYQHFSSKNDLHQAVLSDVGRRLEEMVFTSTARAGSPREQVESGFAAYVAFVTEDFDGFSLLFSRAGREDSKTAEIASRVERTMSNGVAELIRVEGMDEQHRHILAQGIVGMAEGMVRAWRNQEGEQDPQALVRDLTTLAWVGLRGLDADR